MLQTIFKEVQNAQELLESIFVDKREGFMCWKRHDLVAQAWIVLGPNELPPGRTQQNIHMVFHVIYVQYIFHRRYQLHVPLEPGEVVHFHTAHFEDSSLRQQHKLVSVS